MVHKFLVKEGIDVHIKHLLGIIKKWSCFYSILYETLYIHLYSYERLFFLPWLGN